MKKEMCYHHDLPKTSGNFCEKCHEDLDKVSTKLNNFFSRITIEVGKNGEPIIKRKATSPEVA